MKPVIFILLLSIGTIGCKKDNDSCFDPYLVHDGPCLTDCPGFEGCDGKMYCNACDAARVGIGPKLD